MMQFIPKDIEEYCILHSDEEPEIYQRLTEETYSTMAIPQMLSGPLVGNFLQLVIRLTKAKKALDIGTFTGYSALKIAEAMDGDGVVYTFDLKSDHVKFAKRYFAEVSCGSRINMLEGEALELLKTIKSSIDVAFIDADKENYLNYYKRCMELLMPGGVILLDNALWSGRALEPEDPSSRGVAETNDFIQSDERVNNVLLPIRDGVMVAQKK